MEPRKEITLYKDDFKDVETFLDVIKEYILTPDSHIELEQYLDENLYPNMVTINTFTQKVTFED